MRALRHFYYGMGSKIWREYGFVDAFNETLSWYAPSHLGIDQGPIIVMIENYRSGLLWNLFDELPRSAERSEAAGVRVSQTLLDSALVQNRRGRWR